MSQSDFGTINPTTKSGTQLATDLNNDRDAMQSSHKGASEPSYKKAGMLWLDDAANPIWYLKIYDGTDWITCLTLDVTNDLCSADFDRIFSMLGPAISVTTAGTANNYTASISPAPSSLVAGMFLFVTWNVANTGSSQLNLNGLGAKTLKTPAGATLDADDLPLNGTSLLFYNGTNYILLSNTFAKIDWLTKVKNQTGNKIAAWLSNVSALLDFSTSTSLGGVGTSDTTVPSQKAVKTYVDAQIAALTIPQNFEIISTNTVSNVAALDITNLTGYTEYWFEFVRVVGSGSSVIQLRTSSNNGTTWDIGSGFFGYISQAKLANTATPAVDNNLSTSSAINLSNPSIDVSADTSGVYGWMKAFGFSVAARAKTFIWDICYQTTGSNNPIVQAHGTGTRSNSSSVLNAVRFQMASGNITGTINVYGVKP